MENKFTPAQIEKINNCKTMEEVKAFAERERMELTDEELQALTGGIIPHFRITPNESKENESKEKKIIKRK